MGRAASYVQCDGQQPQLRQWNTYSSTAEDRFIENERKSNAEKLKRWQLTATKHNNNNHNNSKNERFMTRCAVAGAGQVDTYFRNYDVQKKFNKKRRGSQAIRSAEWCWVYGVSVDFNASEEANDGHYGNWALLNVERATENRLWRYVGGANGVTKQRHISLLFIQCLLRVAWFSKLRHKGNTEARRRLRSPCSAGWKF